MTEHNIGRFERAVARLEEAERTLLEAISLLGFRTLEEFEECYLPEHCRKQSVRMRVLKEVKKLAGFMRRNLKKEVKR